eukprot:4052802-Pyramimonas_sp.AAC.1
MGEYAEDVYPPTHEWDTRVTEFLQLYVDMTDPRLTAWTDNLTFQEKCQAITQIARQNGHSWAPFVGEDIAAMMKTGQSPNNCFHPLCKMQVKKYQLWSCTVHLVSDSTVSLKAATGKNVTPGLHVKHLLSEFVQGMSANVMGDCKGPDLQEASKAHSWSDSGHQHYKKGVHTPV